MRRYEVINKIIKDKGFKKYLEIGVYTGQCIREINVEMKHGVDPGSEGHVAPEVTHMMTSNEFFYEVDKDFKYDIIFIDGLHHSEQVDEDIKNALFHLVDGGVIVLHDCNPEEELHTLVPRVSGIWHGDVYKSVLKFRKKGLHTFFTVDTDSGCGVIVKDNKSYVLENPELYDEAERSWKVFYENKQELLNLVRVYDFEKLKF
jgi:hypothetical protein